MVCLNCFKKFITVLRNVDKLTSFHRVNFKRHTNMELNIGGKGARFPTKKVLEFGACLDFIEKKVKKLVSDSAN